MISPMRITPRNHESHADPKTVSALERTRPREMLARGATRSRKRHWLQRAAWLLSNVSLENGVGSQCGQRRVVPSDVDESGDPNYA